MNIKERVKKIKNLLGLRSADSENEYYRVADVLCDLKHFCDAKKINFHDELYMSETFYEQEKEFENEI